MGLHKTLALGLGMQFFFSEKTLRKSALWLRKVPQSSALREKWTYPQFYGLYSVNRLMIRATLCLSYSKYTFLLLKIFTLCLIFTHASSLSSWILGKMTEIAQRPTSMIGLEYTPLLWGPGTTNVLTWQFAYTSRIYS